VAHAGFAESRRVYCFDHAEQRTGIDGIELLRRIEVGPGCAVMTWPGIDPRPVMRSVCGVAEPGDDYRRCTHDVDHAGRHGAYGNLVHEALTA
jgi:hypothetical protein